MPRTFTTQDMTDVDVDQIILTLDQVARTVRIRADVVITLTDVANPANKTQMTLQINKTAAELGVGPAVVALRQAVLNAIKAQVA